MAESKLTKNGDGAALAKILELTEPHVPEMIDVLVKLARTSKREPVRARAASKLLELHMLASAAAAGDGKRDDDETPPKVIYVTEDQIKRLSEIQRLRLSESSQPRREAEQATTALLDIEPPRLIAETRFGRQR